jgi:hypothetical protein
MVQLQVNGIPLSLLCCYYSVFCMAYLLPYHLFLPTLLYLHLSESNIRWTQIFDQCSIPSESKVLKARRISENGPFAPPPISEAKNLFLNSLSFFFLIPYPFLLVIFPPFPSSSSLSFPLHSHLLFSFSVNFYSESA